MKKTVFLCGILALAAGLFSSCEDDIEDDNNYQTRTVAKGKKLLVSTKETWYYSDEKTIEMKYEYDDNGKFINAISSVSSKVYDFYNFTDTVYGGTTDLLSNGKKFIRNQSTDFNADGTIAKSNFSWKLISEVRGDTSTGATSTVYTYDSERHLISKISYDALTGEQDSSETSVWIWEDGNISKYFQPHNIVSEQQLYTPWLFEYTHDEDSAPIENKTGFSFYSYGSSIVYSNIYGVGTKNLPVIIINGETGVKQRIDWTLDSDGYPIKEEVYWADKNGQAIVDKNNEKIRVTTIDFTWK